MSLSICTECFARLRVTPVAHIVLSRPFSTTGPLAFEGKKGKSIGNKVAYRQRVTGSARRPPRTVPKLPLIGERKALRKRIVISNTNALEVPGMQDFDAANMADEAQVGRVLGLSGDLLDQLREVKAFKRTQDWKMFRNPGTLMRSESVQLGRTMLDVNAARAEERPRTVRQIIAGERSTGKSLMLLQAMSMAFVNDWVVINVPEGMGGTRVVIFGLTWSRPGIYDRSFSICTDESVFKQATVGRRSIPNPTIGIRGLEADYLQPANPDG